MSLTCRGRRNPSGGRGCVMSCGRMVGGSVLRSGFLVIASSASAAIIIRPSDGKFPDTEIVEVLEQTLTHVQ